MQTRAEIKEYILQIENQWPVDEWKINDVHLWPYIRIKLFTLLITQNEQNYKSLKPQEDVRSNTNTSNESSVVNGFGRFRKNPRVLRLEAKYRIFKLPKSNLLVGTSASHRSLFEGKSYNRFADPILDKLGGGLNLETSPLNQYNLEIINKSQRVIYFYDYFNAILKSDSRKERLGREKHFALEGYEEFTEEVNNKLVGGVESANLSRSSLDKLMNRFYDFAETYELILQKTKPDTVISVCYYTFSIMVLNYVANKKGIQTIEVQHGPQAEGHMSYDSWEKTPLLGYNTMPKYFWNWDEYSYNLMGNWIRNQNHHSNFVAGNPWVQYFDEAENNRNIVLYSLQNFTIESSFPNYLIDAIRSSTCEWWLRLHPRFIADYEELEGFLNQKEILDKVNITEATNTPLPKVLSRTIVHVTNSSGCTLEAKSFGVPTLLISENGRQYFKELIDQGYASFCNDPLRFEEELSKLKQLVLENRGRENYDWNKIIDELK